MFREGENVDIFTLRAARRPRFFTLNVFDSGHDTSSGWSTLSSNAALKQSSDWAPPGAQGRGSGAPGGPRGPFGAPGGVFCGCFPFRLEFFRPKARSVEKTQVCTFKLEIFRQKGHSVEKTRGGSVQARVFSTKCTRRRDRRVFSSRLAPKGSSDTPRPKVVKS